MGTERALLSFYGGSFGAHHKPHACLLFMESRKSRDIRLVTGFMSRPGSGSCQAAAAAQPNPVLFCVDSLFCFGRAFQVYHCMHVTFYRLWQDRNTLQRALMIQIDHFTTYSLKPSALIGWRCIPASPIVLVKPLSVHLSPHLEITQSFPPLPYQEHIKPPLNLI